ncbi:hypothetical protein DSL72_006691 [Monilinia vaccinii-corymbosi]|uniref:Uncharacterized protein n=1 Tax=Monilinia vaccinii-corymbosi TaxID=61207 RepID=A0A8A3PN23_9HELO|nr:hypothetical protein DSL72_006691 [Monilinia vaccinii-corymbosi]
MPLATSDVPYSSISLQPNHYRHSDISGTEHDEASIRKMVAQNGTCALLKFPKLLKPILRCNIRYPSCIGVIAQMLIKTEANTADACYPALDVKYAELVHVVRKEESTRSNSFAKIKLMTPILNIPTALDQCTDEDIKHLKRMIPD